MATFGAIGSASPEIFFNPMAADQAVAATQRNRLLMQGAQEDRAIARVDREREEIGRVSAALLSLPADQRPTAYSAAVADLRRNGLAMQAPAEYPGDARVEQLARSALPAAKQFELAQKQQQSEFFERLLSSLPGAAGLMGGGAVAGGGMAAGAGSPPPALGGSPAPASPPLGPRLSYEQKEQERAQHLGDTPEQLAARSAQASTVPPIQGGYRANEGVGGVFRGVPPPTGTINPLALGGVIAMAKGNAGLGSALIGLSGQQASQAERATDNARADLGMAIQQRNHAESMGLQRENAARAAATEAERLRLAQEANRRTEEQVRLQHDPEQIGRETRARTEAQQEAKSGEVSAKAREAMRGAEAEAARVNGAIERFRQVFREQGGGSLRTLANDPTNPRAQTLNTAYDNLEMVMRSEALMNTGVLQPAEMKMLQEKLLSPRTARGYLASPDAMDAKLNEIRDFVNRGVAARRASLGAGSEGGQAPARLRFNPATGRIE